jgi:hypothetical protein
MVKTQVLLDDMRKADIPTGVAAKTVVETAFATGQSFALSIFLNISRRCRTSNPNRSSDTRWNASV